ncbi:MAG: hypothetical protein JW832_12560 [Deltaproteobacteria bacterium]|nr:hypothetical protein [Deltaproteobacteria bacterium]
MKTYTYQPGSGPIPGADSDGTDPLDALAKVIFRHDSLDTAVKELQRRGVKGDDGSKIFVGLKDLLEQVKQKKKAALHDLNLDAMDMGLLEKISEFAEALPYGSDARGAFRKSSSHLPETMLPLAQYLDDRFNRDGQKLSLREAQLLSGTVKDLDRLEKTLHSARWGSSFEAVDDSLIEKALGSDALAKWQAIKNLPSMLVERGLASQSRTQLMFTPAGLQKTAWGMLREIVKPGRNEKLCRRASAGLNTEPYLIAGTRPYRFGDLLQIDTSGSLMNTLKRTGGSPPLRMAEEDLAVYEKEPVLRTATVVLLDLSKSMKYENRYVAAKKVALALIGLIRSRYVKDRIAVVGFSTSARLIPEHEIPFLPWDEDNPYTNFEEAFAIGQHVLARMKGYRRQMFLITDGEPTAHREAGQLFFQFPPHPETLRRTMAAVDALTRQKIGLSIFLFSQEQERVGFMHEMARRSSGRIFHLHPADLGRCMLMDYLDKKQRWY